MMLHEALQKHNQIMQFTRNWITKEALRTEASVPTCQNTWCDGALPWKPTVSFLTCDIPLFLLFIKSVHKVL